MTPIKLVQVKVNSKNGGLLQQNTQSLFCFYYFSKFLNPHANKTYFHKKGFAF